jgi:hypothetical protein
VNWQKALQAAVAIGAIGILELTGFASEDASILQGQRSVAPAGVELTDDELLQVDGEGAVLALAAAIAAGSITTFVDAYSQWHDSGVVDWPLAATKGVAAGGATITAFAIPASAPFVKSVVASGLRWTAAAAAAVSRGLVSAAQATGSAVSTGAQAVANAFTSAWNWFARKP